eukprot:6750950-Alexandrium_andersonii.AAC.1
MARGPALDEDARTHALDQLLPDEFRRALDDKLGLQSFTERLQFAKAPARTEEAPGLGAGGGSASP